MSGIIRKSGTLMAMLLAGIVAGYLLLAAVYCLPVEPMAANVRASVPALNGEWGKEDSYEQLVKGYETTQLDNTTDAVMMLAAVYDDDQSPFVQAAEGRSNIGEETAFHTMLAYAEGAEQESVSVARYWHGYLVFLKPLLMVMSYLDIRMLLMMVQGALMAAVIAGMVRRRLGFILPAFLVSTLCITPSVTGFSLQFSTALYIMLCAMIALLYLPAGTIKANLSAVFLLTGMVTSYVDYLTYPIATLGMPLCLCLFLFPETDWRVQLRRFAACCLCWALGYFGMWAGKWIIAGLFSRDQWFWANLVDKIRQRSSNQSDEVTITYLDVLLRVIKPFLKRAYLAAGAVLSVVAVGLLVRARRKHAFRKPTIRAALLVLIALMPFAWYFVTKNHSYNHAFFTSRALCVSVFALVALLISACKGNTARDV